MSAVWFLVVLGTGRAIHAASWAWHHYWPRAWAFGIIPALALAFLALRQAVRRGGREPSELAGAVTLIGGLTFGDLPCTQAPPDKPDHVFWASVWAQHVHHDTGEYPTLEMALHHQLPLNVPGPESSLAPSPRAGDQLAILEDERRAFMAGEQ